MSGEEESAISNQQQHPHNVQHQASPRASAPAEPSSQVSVVNGNHDVLTPETSSPDAMAAGQNNPAHMSTTNSTSHGSQLHVQSSTPTHQTPSIPELTSATLSPASPATSISNTSSIQQSATQPVFKTPYGKWRPAYLRKTVLASFVILFTSLAALVQLINWLSYNRNGLQAANESLSWLWVFSPTIIVTIINSLWGRVAYQSMRYSPWIRLASWAPGQPAEKTPQRTASRTLLVDYPNMSPPKAVWQALRYGDPLVAASILVTFVVWIQITISTGLINLEPMAMGEFSIPITLQDEFISMPAMSPNASVQSIPMTTINGMITVNVTLPSGHVPGYAFQQFSPVDDITSDSIRVMEAKVRASSVDVQCDTLPLGEQPLKRPDLPDVLFFRFKSTRHCKTPGQYLFQISAQNVPDVPEGKSYFWIYDDRTACSERKDVIVAAVVAVNRRGDDLTYLSSSHILCKSSLVIGDVMVRQESGLQPVVVPSGKTNAIVDTNIVSQIHNHRLDNIRYGADMQANSGSDYIKELQLSPFRVGASLVRGGHPPSVTEYLESSALEEVMMAWIQQFGALIAHYNSRSAISQPATVTASAIEDRLVVNSNVAIGMTGGFVLMALLAAWMVYRAPRAAGFAPRDPDTISGSCVLFSKGSELMDVLHGTGSSGPEEVEPLLKGSYRAVLKDSPESSLSPTFHIEQDSLGANVSIQSASSPPSTPNRQFFQPWSPIGLRLWSRLVGLFCTVVMLTAIIVLLDHSNRNSGFLSVSDDSRIQYLWTILPTLFMEALTVYVRGCDFSLRALAPFTALQSRRETFDRALSVSYTNELGIFTLIKSVKQRNYAVLASKMIAILATTLPIVSNALFAVEQLGATVDVRVQQITEFAPADYEAQSWQAPSAVGSLLLRKDFNSSFPQWSYEEWAFHTQQLIVDGQDASLDVTGLTVEARIPAVSVDLDCRINITETSQGMSSDGGIVVPHEGVNITCFAELDCQKHEYFGGSLGGSYLSSSCQRGRSDSLPDVTNYIWGRCANDKIVFLARLSCEEVAVEQHFDLTLHGPDLVMDGTGNSRPVPITESRRPYNFSGKTTRLYDSIDPLNIRPLVDTNPSGALLDRFFRSLINEKVTLPLSDLSSRNTADRVIQAIKKQHGIIRAQTLNYDGRSVMADTPAIRVPLTPAPEPTAARATTPKESRNRLLQSAPATWVLVAVMALMMILTVTSIIITDKVQIPKSPGSIASIASLLADSTILSHLPPLPGGGVQWMGEKELESWFEKKGVTFQMGWFGQAPPRGRGRYYTIGVVEDEEIAMGNMTNATTSLGHGRQGPRSARQSSPSTPGISSGSQAQLVGGAAPMGASGTAPSGPDAV
ncbi:hypothetical protein QBC41DRAFT_112335 [Cercophora samala]|uniref:Uncharacterized protein n=1 Tax=Cercophora samala TaxID=330535 RepID=A0AA39ZDL7_9PEZI|nr:hypothetical protein QBC41DRAFT_112335 [Cercophora samala]